MAQKKYVSLTRLSEFLDNLRDTFATLSHSHKLSDITDYEIDNSLSSTSTNPVQNKVIDEEFEAVANAMNALDLAIDGKANIEHDHSDVYYTKTEIYALELITVADIDEICDATIYTASEVDF